MRFGILHSVVVSEKKFVQRQTAYQVFHKTPAAFANNSVQQIFAGMDLLVIHLIIAAVPSVSLTQRV